MKYRDGKFGDIGTFGDMRTEMKTFGSENERRVGIRNDIICRFFNFIRSFIIDLHNQIKV